jgi:hypothetical protein
MAAHLLHQYGVAVPVMKGLKYSTEAGAARALKRTGFADLIDAVDALGLERIAPAAARTGDLIGMPCDGPWGCALTVAVGNGRVFGFLDGNSLPVRDCRRRWRSGLSQELRSNQALSGARLDCGRGGADQVLRLVRG